MTLRISFRSILSGGTAVFSFCILSPLFGQGDEAPPVSVEALVQHVLATNPEANFYRSEIAAAKGEARTAVALRKPEFAAELGHKRVRSATGATAGDGAAWSVSVQQTFDFPGRIPLRKAIAARQIELVEILASCRWQSPPARAPKCSVRWRPSSSAASSVRRC